MSNSGPGVQGASLVQVPLMTVRAVLSALRDGQASAQREAAAELLISALPAVVRADIAVED